MSLRYEHIELDWPTTACDELRSILDESRERVPLGDEVLNLMNELLARLQRRDVDVQCPKNAPTEDWLDT